MLVLEKVKIKISGHNIQHYEKLGYKIPKYTDYWNRTSVKRGTEIEVSVKDLMKKSPIKVLRKCDNCGKIEEVKWYAYRDICSSCIHTLIKKQTYTIEDVKKNFKENNCELLSTEYIRNDLPLEYICSCCSKS
jgi:hypothetical protein